MTQLSAGKGAEAMNHSDKSAWSALFEALAVEFPLAFNRWVLGGGKGSKEVEEAALKTCQAWTSLANETVNRVHQAQGFFSLMSSSLGHFVQWQRLGQEYVDLVLRAGTAPAPASIEDSELREMVSKLRREVRQLTARVNYLSHSEARLKKGERLLREVRK